MGGLDRSVVADAESQLPKAQVGGHGVLDGVAQLLHGVLRAAGAQVERLGLDPKLAQQPAKLGDRLDVVVSHGLVQAGQQVQVPVQALPQQPLRRPAKLVADGGEHLVHRGDHVMAAGRHVGQVGTLDQLEVAEAEDQLVAVTGCGDLAHGGYRGGLHGLLRVVHDDDGVDLVEQPGGGAGQRRHRVGRVTQSFAIDEHEVGDLARPGGVERAADPKSVDERREQHAEVGGVVAREPSQFGHELVPAIAVAAPVQRPAIPGGDDVGGAEQLDAGLHLCGEEFDDFVDRRVAAEPVLEQDMELLFRRVGADDATLDHRSELGGDRLFQEPIDLGEDGVGVGAELVDDGVARVGVGGEAAIAQQVAQPESLIDVVQQPSADFAGGPVVEDGQRCVDHVFLEIGADLDQRHERGHGVVGTGGEQYLGLGHGGLRRRRGRERLVVARTHELADERGLARAGGPDDEYGPVAGGLGRPRQHHLAKSEKGLTAHGECLGIRSDVMDRTKGLLQLFGRASG